MRILGFALAGLAIAAAVLIGYILTVWVLEGMGAL